MSSLLKVCYLGLICLVLSACAKQLPVLQQAPNPVLSTAATSLQLTWKKAGQIDEQYLLVIQQQQDTSRWSLFDPIGIPVLRQQLVGKQWQAEGLLPPNAQAMSWLHAVLFALLDTTKATKVYADLYLNPMQRTLENFWLVSYLEKGAFMIEFSDASVLTVRPMDMQ